MNGGTINFCKLARSHDFVLGYMNDANTVVNMDAGVMELGDVQVGLAGNGEIYLDGGVMTVHGGLVATGTGTGLFEIAGGKLILKGEHSSAPQAYLTYGSGYTCLDFDYEADLAGYTTITAVPEPATIALLGFGALALIRRKR